MNRRTLLLIAFAIALGLPLAAQRHRTATPSPSPSMTADVLGIGPMGGASIGGTVLAVSGNIVTLKSGGATPIAIDVTGAKILADRNASGSVADIHAGARIMAFINAKPPVVAGAALLAQVVVIDTQPDLFVSGAIQSIDVAARTFTVLGIPLATDANTIFSSAFPTFAPIKDVSGLATGQFVEVDAAFAGTALLAKRVLVTSPGDPAATMLHGTVKSIGQTAWVITDKSGKDVTVQVNDHTKIAGDLKVGDEVQVLATTDAAGASVAVLIVKVVVPLPGAQHVQGWVKSIAADQWTIGGPPGSMAPEFLVKITPATVIYANPKVGDVVDAVGTRDSSGIFVATTIQLAKRP